jgi:hypothetical protein
VLSSIILPDQAFRVGRLVLGILRETSEVN